MVLPHNWPCPWRWDCCQVLGSNLETLAAVLEVEVDAVLDLVIRQPTLLASQVREA